MIEESPLEAERFLKTYNSKQVNRLSNGHLAKEHPRLGQHKQSEQHTDDDACGVKQQEDEEGAIR